MISRTVGVIHSRHGRRCVIQSCFLTQTEPLLQIYSFDPLANLTGEQTKLILGGELTFPCIQSVTTQMISGETLLWTEQSDPSNLDSIAWPRAAASAEVFWTGPTLPDGTQRSGSEALSRLHDIRYRFVQRGVRAIPLQPLWCALRPGLCDLNA